MANSDIYGHGRVPMGQVSVHLPEWAVWGLLVLWVIGPAAVRAGLIWALRLVLFPFGWLFGYRRGRVLTTQLPPDPDAEDGDDLAVSRFDRAVADATRYGQPDDLEEDG